MTPTNQTAAVGGHTPTPWIAAEHPHSGHPLVAADNALVVADCANNLLSADEESANAALIVRAVNSHAALVEALRDLLSATEEVGYVHYAPLRKKARAALQQAGAGGHE